MRDTDKDWNWIAAVAPYWGVLSDDRFRGIDIAAEHHGSFFDSGRRFVADTMGFIHRHIEADFRPDRSLDFGCGVGRLLLPLAALSRQAVGVDIAPQMLDLAAQHARAAKLDNVTLVQGDDELSAVEGPFNFVNSYIVLQHIPPARGYVIIDRLIDLLGFGGVFSLQLTYAKSGKFLAGETQHVSAYRRAGDIIESLSPPVGAPPQGTITMFDYDLNRVMIRLAAIAGQPLLALPTDHDGHFGVHLIGRKAR
jgi:SAM-dependent methyltransferase